MKRPSPEENEPSGRVLFVNGVERFDRDLGVH